MARLGRGRFRPRRNGLRGFSPPAPGAARAIDLRAPLSPSAGSAAAIAVLRESVDGPGPDRFLAPDIAEAESRLADGTLLAAVEGVIGDLR